MRSGGRHRPCLPRTCGRPRHACRSTRSRLCQAARSHRGFCPRALELCQQQRGRSRLHRRTRPLNPRRLRLLSRPRERAPCGQVGATRRTNRAASLCVCVVLRCMLRSVARLLLVEVGIAHTLTSHLRCCRNQPCGTQYGLQQLWLAHAHWSIKARGGCEAAWVRQDLRRVRR